MTDDSKGNTDYGLPALMCNNGYALHDNEILHIIAFKLFSLEIEMSQITDAVTANSAAVSNLGTAQAALTTQVDAVTKVVQDLQTQVANDDTAGNTAAVAELATANATLVAVTTALTDASTKLASLATATPAPVSTT